MPFSRSVTSSRLLINLVRHNLGQLAPFVNDIHLVPVTPARSPLAALSTCLSLGAQNMRKGSEPVHDLSVGHAGGQSAMGKTPVAARCVVTSCPSGCPVRRALRRYKPSPGQVTKYNNWIKIDKYLKIGNFHQLLALRFVLFTTTYWRHSAALRPDMPWIHESQQRLEPVQMIREQKVDATDGCIRFVRACKRVRARCNQGIPTKVWAAPWCLSLFCQKHRNVLCYITA
ncbi:hypothetical protein [Corticibacter populi]|uniref:hypothetical protein n=2 Tax=Corticibacter populi TaxID=1550736 RepID=UPI00102CAE38|nr:hypothetical protein [Corticibacter populi]